MTMAEKKAYPVSHLVNWYFGNYCMRKCFDKDERLREHYERLSEFAKKNPASQMTHREFLDLFNNYMTICALDPSFKQKTIGWKLFTIVQHTPDYDSDKIIVEKGLVKTSTGPLEEPRGRCKVCIMFGCTEL